MTFSNLLERIEEVETQIKESDSKHRDKHYKELEKLESELEDRIRRQNF